MGHFYQKDGSPCHYQENGRETTLRDARKQDLVPSVTGILDVMDKPGLNRYITNKLLEAAWEYLINDGDYELDYAEWCKVIRQKSSEHAEQARLAGVAIHDALDKAFSGQEVPDEHLTTVDAVTAAISGVYGDLSHAASESTFATESYGGTVDLTLFNNDTPNGVIIDFKRKTDGWDLKKDGTPKKMWYLESHAAQLAAYRSGLKMHDAKCANVFIDPDDNVYIHEWSEEDLAKGLTIFQDCLKLWKDLRGF